MKHHVSGSITVFFSLITSFVILLLVVLLVLEQYMAAVVRGRQILDLSARSVLAGYNLELQENYGFYAIESETLASDDLNYFWEANLGSYTGDEISLSADSHLTDREVYEEQLSNYMKYYLAEDLITQYTDWLDTLGDASEASQDLDNEVTAAEITETYDQLFQSAVENIEGTDLYGGSQERYIKNFWNGSWQEDAFRNLLEMAEEDPDAVSGSISAWKTHIIEYETLNQETYEIWEELCSEGQRILPELEALKEQAETTEVQEELEKLIASLHVGDSSDQRVGTLLKKNGELLEEAATGMEQLEDQQVTAGLRKARKALDYSTAPSVAYEYSEQTDRRSWKSIWNELQHLVTDLSEYVADEDRFTEDIQSSLPSSETGSEDETESSDETDLLEDSESLSEAVESLPETTLIKLYNIEYIISKFVDLSDRIEADQDDPDRFFQTEIEYVIGGSGNESENCNTVRLRILAIRMIFNTAFLLKDSEKRAEIRAAAAATGGIIAPGLGNLIAAALITACWAALESYCDYEKLIHGSAVPLAKSRATWQTDLDQVEQMTWDSETYENVKGLTYKDYEKILMLLMDLDTVEDRTMDLIQLDLQILTDSELLLKNMVTGFTASGSYYVNNFPQTAEGSYAYD